MMKPKTT